MTLLACGEDAVAPRAPGFHEAPIQGGYTDQTDTAVVGIVNFGGGGIGICSGTLIADNLILTAQHCVANTIGEVRGGVVCGVTDFAPPYDHRHIYVTTALSLSRSVADYRAVVDILVPPGEGFCGRDIALMVLADPVPASVARPRTPRVDEVLWASSPYVSATGEPYSAIGYGNTSDVTDDSGVRRRRDGLNVTCVHDQCPSRWSDEREWIGDQAVCSGDSGGPAVDHLERVVGVASRGGENCSSPVYTSVHGWGDWLMENAQLAASLGGLEAPRWALGWPTHPAYYSPVGNACENNSACGAGFCSDRRCTRACNALATCPDGWGCSGDRCALLPVGGACDDDATCGAGRSCRDGFCSRPCSETASCPEGWICDGTCALPWMGDPCSAPDTCQGGLCQDGRCTRACGDDVPCHPGADCVDGVCVVQDMGVRCAADADCEGGTCLDGRCTRDCSLQTACVDGWACDGGSCALATIGADCERDDACDGGMCVDGACTRACHDRAPCPDGHHCGGDGTCAVDAGCQGSSAPGPLAGALLVLLMMIVARRRGAPDAART